MTTKIEVNKACEWLGRRGLTLDQMVRLTGYSRSTLYWYFRGLTPPRSDKASAGRAKSKPVEAPEWLRFRTLCAGVEWQLQRGKSFDW